MRGIDDGVQLANLIGDALEWGLPVSHTVQDTPKGPHVTFGADLSNKLWNALAPLLQPQLTAHTVGSVRGSKSTFERAFPGWDEVSLMASGGI